MDIENNIKENFKKTDPEELASEIEEMREYLNKGTWNPNQTTYMFNLHNKYTGIIERGKFCPPCRLKVKNRCVLINEIYKKDYEQQEQQEETTS